MRTLHYSPAPSPVSITNLMHRNSEENIALRVAVLAPMRWKRRAKVPKSNLPVSQICALTVFPSTLMDLVANSTPIVDLESRLNSFLVNRESRLDLPTPESPIRTT